MLLVFNDTCWIKESCKKEKRWSFVPDYSSIQSVHFEIVCRSCTCVSYCNAHLFNQIAHYQIQATAMYWHAVNDIHAFIIDSLNVCIYLSSDSYRLVSTLKCNIDVDLSCITSKDWWHHVRSVCFYCCLDCCGNRLGLHIKWLELYKKTITWYNVHCSRCFIDEENVQLYHVALISEKPDSELPWR